MTQEMTGTSTSSPRPPQGSLADGDSNLVRGYGSLEKFSGGRSIRGPPRDVLPTESDVRHSRKAYARLAWTIGVLQSEIAKGKRAEEALKDANRRKDEFLAMLAHELHNPLASVQNAVEILRRMPVDDPSSVWSRDMIGRQVEHLTRIVDDLLDIPRISQGGVELKKEAIELAVVIARAAETTRPMIDARGHVLLVQLADHAVRIHGDPIRLTQVVTNLLNNAAKYTEGRGTIWVTLEHGVGHGHSPDEALIRVRDTGMGIAPEMLSRVFDPFVRAGKALEHAPGGLGIGLAVVRKLVELHHGTVSARSDGEGRGSEFVVCLPILP
jgi:signal transduction histidine kinase